jgi:subtilase family serine protease
LIALSVATSADISIPSSLAGLVSGVIGLDQSSEFVHTNHVVETDAPPSPGFRNSPPLSDYWAQLVSPYAYPAGFTDVVSPSTAPWSIKGHTPAQIKGAYGISGYDGTGQTVAIIDAYASPTILEDVNQWSTNRGIPQFGTPGGGTFTQIVAPGTYNMPEGPVPPGLGIPVQDPQGWYSEETLDVEAVHGMAPNTHIIYVGAPNHYRDFDAAMNHVVDNHLAQIVSNSYGYQTELLPPGYIKPFEDILIQAALEGIGIYFASGDYGDETINFGFATTEYPPSSPWVTAVGGTALGVSAGNIRAIETGWGVSNYNCNTVTLECTRTAWTVGSGGGVSQVFAEPFYQKNAGLSLTGRGVPDIAALADIETGFLIGQTQAFPRTCNAGNIPGTYYDEYRIGGTSVSCPVMAGLMALADQKAGFAHGFANPLFYGNYHTSGAFYDVTSVKTAVARRNYVNSVDACDGISDRLRTFDDYSGSPTQSTGPGWDNVTGLGSPGSAFLSILGQ